MALTQVDQGLLGQYAQYTGFKNRLINGSMVFDQRNAGASVTVTGSAYTLDRWAVYSSQSSKYSVQQNAGSVTPPAGFSNYLGVTSLSAYSVTTTDFFNILQFVEGFNFADLGWGSANASPVTLSFWVRSSLTGTFGGSLRNNAGNRSYPFSYTVSSANTWEQKTITIAGDTSGTWVGATNGIGVGLFFGLGVGATYSGAAGSWASANYVSATGATSVVGTNGATFYITGVQLEKGSTATSFDYRPYGTEFALCQRYYAKLTAGTSAYCSFGSGIAYSGTTANIAFNYPVTMRATPTFSLLSVGLFYGAAAITPITAINAQYGGTSNCGLQVSAPGATMTTGYAASMIANNSTSAYVDMTAEL